jgi:hypothetical protein
LFLAEQLLLLKNNSLQQDRIIGKRVRGHIHVAYFTEWRSGNRLELQGFMRGMAPYIEAIEQPI